MRTKLVVASLIVFAFAFGLACKPRSNSDLSDAGSGGGDYDLKNHPFLEFQSGSLDQAYVPYSAIHRKIGKVYTFDQSHCDSCVPLGAIVRQDPKTKQFVFISYDSGKIIIWKAGERRVHVTSTIDPIILADNFTGDRTFQSKGTVSIRELSVSRDLKWITAATSQGIAFWVRNENVDLFSDDRGIQKFQFVGFKGDTPYHQVAINDKDPRFILSYFKSEELNSFGFRRLNPGQADAPFGPLALGAVLNGFTWIPGFSFALAVSSNGIQKFGFNSTAALPEDEKCGSLKTGGGSLDLEQVQSLHVANDSSKLLLVGANGLHSIPIGIRKETCEGKNREIPDILPFSAGTGIANFEEARDHLFASAGRTASVESQSFPFKAPGYVASAHRTYDRQYVVRIWVDDRESFYGKQPWHRMHPLRELKLGTERPVSMEFIDSDLFATKGSNFRRERQLMILLADGYLRVYDFDDPIGCYEPGGPCVSELASQYFHTANKIIKLVRKAAEPEEMKITVKIDPENLDSREINFDQGQTKISELQKISDAVVSLNKELTAIKGRFKSIILQYNPPLKLTVKTTGLHAQKIGDSTNFYSSRIGKFDDDQQALYINAAENLEELRTKLQKLQGYFPSNMIKTE